MDDLDAGDLPDFGGGGAEIVEGEELGNLISFANLENVVKHIIGKFKSIESHNDSTNDTIQQIRKDLESRATNVSVEDFAAELGQRVEGIKAVLQAQKENITSLETQLERSRSTSNVIEKKLDACVKEKAVQDRLIRETQDTLQDKVAIAELNMFEAKFAGYTTKLELQEVINSMSHCARVDVTDRIAESVRALSTCFDDYSRTAKVEQQLQALRDWVGDELQHYAKARAMNDRIDELQARIYDQSLAFERAHSMADDKTRALSDRVTSIYQELNNDLHQRALADDLREVKNGLKKYALKAETDAFQLDCVPKLRFCVDSIAAFDDRLRAQDDAIQRVDEVLLDKAGKYDIVVVSSRVEQCLPKEAAAREHAKLYQRLEWINKKFEEYMSGEAARLDHIRPPDYGPMLDDLSARVTLKADKADLVEMYQLKANRIDTDELAKLQETIHRQLEYLSVTTFGLSKLALTEAKTGDSKTIRTQQKAQVLMQSEALWHWILHNEPPPNLETLRPPPGRHQSKQQGTDPPLPGRGGPATGGAGAARAAGRGGARPAGTQHDTGLRGREGPGDGGGARARDLPARGPRDGPRAAGEARHPGGGERAAAGRLRRGELAGEVVVLGHPPAAFAHGGGGGGGPGREGPPLPEAPRGPGLHVAVRQPHAERRRQERVRRRATRVLSQESGRVLRPPPTRRAS